MRPGHRLTRIKEEETQIRCVMSLNLSFSQMFKAASAKKPLFRGMEIRQLLMKKQKRNRWENSDWKYTNHGPQASDIRGGLEIMPLLNRRSSWRRGQTRIKEERATFFEIPHFVIGLNDVFLLLIQLCARVVHVDGREDLLGGAWHGLLWVERFPNLVNRLL